MRRSAATRALAAALACLGLPAGLPAQVPTLVLPKASQRATVSQTIGLTEIGLTYDRPLVNGREIWGRLVPYDSVWRAGANRIRSSRSARRCGWGDGSCPPAATAFT